MVMKSFSFPRALPATPGLLVLCIALAACTTTVKQSAEPIQPMTSGTSTLSQESELHIADTALQSGNIDLATNIYTQILQANPASVPGLTGLGDTLYAVGDFTRAVVYYDKALAIDPKNLPAMLGDARAAIRQRRLDDAVAAYQKILQLSPNNPLAAAGLGAALDMQGNHDAAQAALRAALQAAPGDPRLETNLGLSLIMAGKPREGANVLLDVTHFPAAPPEAREDLALAYGLLGNNAAATEILEADLPKSSVQDNLRYYGIQRQRLAKAQDASRAQSPQKELAADTGQKTP
jgi:Flp pilus assembly protein TadD